MTSHRSRGLFYWSAALLSLALLLAGGGSSAPLGNMLVALAALPLLFQLLRTGGIEGALRKAGVALLLLILVTPLLQLVPLPYAVWSALPGREFIAEVDALLGRNAPWRPLSVAPEQTWLSAMFLLAPAAIFLATLKLQERERRRLLSIVIILALLSLTLGALQIAFPSGILHIYDSAHRNTPIGLFANRNHQADLLLIALPLGTAWLARSAALAAGQRSLLFTALLAIFSAGVIATSSRMALLLLPIAIAGSLWFARQRIAPGKSLMAVGAGIAIAASAIFAWSGVARAALARFEAETDLRFQFWADSLVAGHAYFPWGSGIGTFATVYQTVEDLNHVGPVYANHAHHDYLQIYVEAGAWGIFLLLLFLAAALWLFFRRGGKRDVYKSAAGIALLILLLHSFVDYPLRVLSLATVFAFLCGLLFPAPSPPQGSASSETR